MNKSQDFLYVIQCEECKCCIYLNIFLLLSYMNIYAINE